MTRTEIRAMGFPHRTADRSVVVFAFVSFVIAAEIDPDKPYTLRTPYRQQIRGFSVDAVRSSKCIPLRVTRDCASSQAVSWVGILPHQH